MRKKISWEPWIDPFCSNIERFYHTLTNEEKLEEYDNNEFSFENEEPTNKIQKLMNSVPSEGEAINKLNSSGKKFFTSPIGIIPIMDHHYVSNNFNLWVGHTNFDITKLIAEQIEKITGVETLEIYSRYRFRISIGKMFDFHEVRIEIEKVICDREPNYDEDSLPKETKEKIKEVINNLKKTNKYWAICLFPNGETKIIHSKYKTKEFDQSLSDLETIQKAIRGVLYTYEDSKR